MRYFKIIVKRTDIDENEQEMDIDENEQEKETILYQYFKLDIEQGYLNRDDVENELLMQGEIDAEDCDSITDIYELTKQEYDRACKKCIEIRSR